MNFAKYGDELSDQQMKQFLRLEDINMNRSSKKGMSIEDQGALKRMKNSVCQTTSRRQKQDYSL